MTLQKLLALTGFLEDGANVLAKPIRDICNLSTSLNKFLSAFKLAKVKSIFKKGWKTDVSNYWPISLLPILLKVIGKVVQKQTTKFSYDNNIFYKYQSGFRNSHSTDLFLSFLNDKFWKVLTMECILAWFWLTCKKHLIQ